MSTTYLYRHFDKEGVLLYIGIASDETRRRKQHLKSSPWFCIVHTIEVEEWHTRELAEKMETAAIIREKPIYNISDSTSPNEAKIKRDEIAKTKAFMAHKIHVKNRVYGKAGVVAEMYRKYITKFGCENEIISSSNGSGFLASIEKSEQLRAADISRGLYWYCVSRFSGYSWWWNEISFAGKAKKLWWNISYRTSGCRRTFLSNQWRNQNKWELSKMSKEGRIAKYYSMFCKADFKLKYRGYHEL